MPLTLQSILVKAWRFTVNSSCQDSISNHFGNYTVHCNKLIGETLDDILCEKCSVHDIPIISVTRRRTLWVTADNRRLWIFKKLQTLGKCEKITVKVTFSINPKKCCVQPNIRVRGHEGGHLWRSWPFGGSTEAKTNDQNKDTSRCIRTIQREVLSYGDHDVPEVQTSATTSVESNYRGYSASKGTTGFKNAKSFQDWEQATESRHRDISSGGYRSRNERCATSISSKNLHPETEPHYAGKSSIASNASVSACSRRTKGDLFTRTLNNTEMNISSASRNPAIGPTRPTYLDRSIQSKITSTVSRTRLRTNDDSKLRESETARSTQSASARTTLPGQSLASYKTSIHLTPLDVSFVTKSTVHPSFDGELLGKLLDEYCEHFGKISINGFKCSLNVFKYQGRYCSEEISILWLLQTIERYTNNVIISGSVISIPVTMPLYRQHDSLRSVVRMPLYRQHDSLRSVVKLSGEKWRSLDFLKNLPTKGKQNLSLSDIFYTTNAIKATLNGRSNIKALVEICTGGIRDHELSVMEFENKYYSLENEKLWILKRAQTVLGNLNITGNLKISMDFILFHSFTRKDIRIVDIT
ncbi:uncharacterized protein LOC125673824 [Ostrea edulis]|uniref:uncharacterized protein LOC125673824 n=1 Tax=Ostrea edulis TaxID=37623 RepID=UPI0024AF3A25|nr:uncharacterized protein LOC125673824 [Ostrea edulis]